MRFGDWAAANKDRVWNGGQRPFVDMLRECWNAAIDAAAHECELNASDQGEWSAGAAACERAVRKLRVENQMRNTKGEA